ncbi:hypothetical protein ACP70R_046833 [Stipagrostis hirtigluma subsp. patula]
MTSVRARGGCCLHPHSVQLNVTLLLTVAVHNPNTAGLLRLHVRPHRPHLPRRQGRRGGDRPGPHPQQGRRRGAPRADGAGGPARRPLRAAGGGRGARVRAHGGQHH